MVRKMAYIGSSYLVGLFFASFFAYIINFCISASLLVAAFLIIILFKNRKVKITVCLLSTMAAFLIYGLYDYNVYQKIIRYDGYDVEIKGVVTDVSEYDGDKSSYTIKGVINSNVEGIVTFYTDAYSVETGDFVSVLGKARVMKDSYKFPAEKYYKAKNIFLQLSKVYKFNYTENNGFSIKKILLQYRNYILKIINRNMNSNSSGIMAAMLFGDKTGIESTEKTLMYRAGIGHIMAVSGVHLSVVCSFIWLIISRVPLNKYIRFMLLIIPVICFVVLAGMSDSVVRAAIMVILVYGSELFRRKADTFNSLGIAVVILTITSPFSVRDASFLLSVTGVFGVGVIAPKIIKDIRTRYRTGKLSEALISSLCVMIVVFPVTTLFFDEVSVISPISNLILLPVCEIVLIGGVIISLTGGIPFVAVPVLKICEVCCVLISGISKFIGSMDFSYIPLGDKNVTLLVASTLTTGIAAGFLCKRIRTTALVVSTVFLSVICLINAGKYLTDDDITVAVINDNSSVSAVIHDNKSACIIDLKNGGKSAEYTVKYLNREGIRKIDFLIMNTDVVSSLVTYDKQLEIFRIDTYMVPEMDRLLVGKERENMTFYGSDSMLTTDKYTVEPVNENTAVIGVNGSRILLCNTVKDIPLNSRYELIVLFSDKSFTSYPDTGTVVVLNEKSEENIIPGTIYTEDGIRFEIDKFGEIHTEAIV